MGLIAKTLNAVLPAGLKAQSDVLMVAPWAHGQPQYPPRNYHSYAVEGFAKNELVYACIAALAQSADEINLVAEQRIKGEWVNCHDLTTRGNGSRAPQAVEAQRLLDEPTPLHDQFLWTQDLITYLHVAGNSYQQIEESASRRPVAMWNLRPDQVRIIPDKRLVVRGYEHDVGGAKVTLDRREIIHHRLLPDPLNPLYGLSPLAVLSRSVDGDNSATDYITYFFDNMGSPDWLAVTKGKVADEEKRRFKAGWKREYGLEAGRRGTGGPGGVAVVDGSQVTMTRIGAFPGGREMGFVDLRQVAEARICAVFRVHPQIAFSLLGFIHPTYAQASMAESIMWTQTYLPLYRRITGRLTAAFRPYYGEDVRVVIDTSGVTALQEDEAEKRTFWLSALQAAGATREEFREKVGLPADADGTFLTPSAVIPEDAKVVEIEGRKYYMTPAGGSGPVSPLGVKAQTAIQRSYVRRLAERRRAVVGELVPALEAYFADQADRVLERVRRQAQGQGALLANIQVQTKKEFPFNADDLMPASEDAGLRVITQPHVLQAVEDGWEATAGEFTIEAAFDVTNPQVARLLSEASSTRVRGITDTTREALRRTLNAGADRGYSVFQLANGVDADSFPGIRSVVEESYRGRAETIARTEIAWGSNQGATALFASEGIDKVEVLDGLDWDEPCQTANGQIWDLARAQAEPLAHPNCQRAFAPVVEDDVDYCLACRSPFHLKAECPEGSVVRQTVEAGTEGPEAFMGDIQANAVTRGSYGDIARRSEEAGKLLRAQWGTNAEFVKMEKAARRFSSASSPIREASRAQMAGEVSNVAEAAKEAAITLSRQVRMAPVQEKSVWRGMSFGQRTSMDDLLASWEVGGTVDVPLSSASFGKDVATFFSKGTKKTGFKGKRVMMEFTDSQGLPIGAFSKHAHELEVLIGGRFEVVTARVRGDLLNVVLKQVATL